MEPQSHAEHPPLERSFAPERGASAVEYGMLVALIAAVVITTLIALGPTVNDLYEAVQWW